MRLIVAHVLQNKVNKIRSTHFRAGEYIVFTKKHLVIIMMMSMVILVLF